MSVLIIVQIWMSWLLISITINEMFNATEWEIYIYVNFLMLLFCYSLSYQHDQVK